MNINVIKLLGSWSFMSEIEIIVGLNGSGKTKFLNSYLEITNVKNERILIIESEYGNTKIRQDFKNVLIKTKVLNSVYEINENKLIYLINVHRPHRIIIETDYLGLSYINKLIESNELKNILMVTSRINIINSRFLDKISKYKLCTLNNNIIIINNYDNLELMHSYLSEIKYNNVNSFLFCVKSFEEIYLKFKQYKLIKSDFHKNVFKYIKELI